MPSAAIAGSSIESELCEAGDGETGMSDLAGGVHCDCLDDNKLLNGDDGSGIAGSEYARLDDTC